MRDVQKALKKLGNYYEQGFHSYSHGKYDHIAPVILRSADIACIINNSGNVPEDKKVNLNLVKSVAVLHDIGNNISRKGHNHYGYGIIMGELTPKQILSVPVKDSAGFYPPQELIDAVLNNLKDGRLDLEKDADIASMLGPDMLPPESLLRIEVARIHLTFQVGYEGYSPEELRGLIASNYNIPGNSRIADKLYNSLVAEDGMYKDSSLRPSNEEMDKIARDHPEENPRAFYSRWLREHAKHQREVTAIVNRTFTPEEKKLIAEAVQDHNIDYKTPEKRTHEDDLGEDSKNRYQARSTYGMIAADADKTTDPISEMIRQHKYALEKHVEEGNKKIVLCDANGRAITQVDKNGRHHYVADVTKVRGFNKKQMHTRFNSLDGTDIHLQLDAKFDLGLSETAMQQLEQFGDDAQTEDGMYANGIVIVENLLADNGYDAGKCIELREKEKYGIKGDLYEAAVDYVPNAEHIRIQEPYTIPTAEINEKAAQIRQMDSGLTEKSETIENINKLIQEANKGVSAERTYEIARELVELRSSLFNADKDRQETWKGRD